MKNPSVTQLIRFAKTHEGARLRTAGGRAFFKVTATGDGLTYTPLSTNKPRGQIREAIAQVLERFAEGGSLRPGDYRDLTVNGSYLLGLLKLYLGKS